MMPIADTKLLRFSFDDKIHFSIIEEFILLELRNDKPFAGLVKAAVDSLIHGAIAASTWAIIRCNTHTSFCLVLELLLCCGLSMGLDVDHFIAARSLHLQVRAYQYF